MNDNVNRPNGELKIINQIDSNSILGPGEVRSLFYKYQVEYALVLWALQEKFEFTYDEATFYCCELFRAVNPLGFIEDVFGIDFEEENQWLEYFNSIVSKEELSKFVGKIEPNRLESDAYQWF